MCVVVALNKAGVEPMEARKLGKASMICSVVGLVIGVILIIIVIVLNVAGVAFVAGVSNSTALIYRNIIVKERVEGTGKKRGERQEKERESELTLQSPTYAIRFELLGRPEQ